jgi:hypothetical protein
MDGIPMKKITIISLVLLAIVLTGCNLPGSQEAADESGDSMATEIAKILTGTPVEISDLTPEAVITEPIGTPDIDETEPEVKDTATEASETATPTPTETPTASPTPTLSDTDPALTLGDPDWVDTMDDGNNWPTGYNDYTSIEFSDGYLKLTAELDMDGWRLTWPYLSDFYLEVAVKSPDCEGNDHYGLMFRVPDGTQANKGYLFGITCDGKYSLRRWNSQVMYFPVDWTTSDAILTGENVENVLGVMAKEGTLMLYINGQKVDEVTDSNYLAGSFGLFVGGTNVEDLTVWVDRIRYWEID